MSIERRYTSQTVEARTAGDKRLIVGYAAKFNKLSQNLGGFVERVAPSFFNKSRGDGWPDVMARYNHDDGMLLGTTAAGTLRLTVDDEGLAYEVDAPASRADVYELVQRGDVRKSSFAFQLGAEGDEWGLSDQGFPMRTLVTGRLVDVAPVNSPAYLDTSTDARSIEGALLSLAGKLSADVAEVRKLAEANELRRMFVRSDGKPAGKIYGPAALIALQGRREPAV
jgi:HK97 family phage prohead protease